MRVGYFSTSLIELVALLLADLDESVVLHLLVCLGLLGLLVCRLRGVTLTGRVLVLLVCRIVCRLGRCHGSVGGVGLLLRGSDGSLGGLQICLCGGVGIRRVIERVLRGLELTSSSVLGGLKRTQVDTRTRDGSIERGLRLVELLLGVIARGSCGCESSGSLLLLGLGGSQSGLSVLLFLLSAGLGSLGLVQIGLCSSNGLIGVIELCLRVLGGLLGSLVLIHTHSLELGLGIVEGLLGLILLCLGVLERLGLILDTLVGLIELIVQVAQLLLLLLGLFDGGFELVNLLLERGDFCCVLLDFVVAHSLRGLILLLLRLLLRLARRVGFLLGGIVGGLSVLELLCRLLGQLGSRLYDRLVTGGNGVLDSAVALRDVTVICRRCGDCRQRRHERLSDEARRQNGCDGAVGNALDVDGLGPRLKVLWDIVCHGFLPLTRMYPYASKCRS